MHGHLLPQLCCMSRAQGCADVQQRIPELLILQQSGGVLQGRSPSQHQSTLV
jgi:hypothetical protein